MTSLSQKRCETLHKQSNFVISFLSVDPQINLMILSWPMNWEQVWMNWSCMCAWFASFEWKMHSSNLVRGRSHLTPSPFWKDLNGDLSDLKGIHLINRVWFCHFVHKVFDLLDYDILVLTNPQQGFVFRPLTGLVHDENLELVHRSVDISPCKGWRILPWNYSGGNRFIVILDITSWAASGINTLK